MSKVNPGQEHSSDPTTKSLVSHQQGLVGRELDAAVAEQVMGLSVARWGDIDVVATSPERLAEERARPMRSYSTDIAAAMEVENRIDVLNARRDYVIALWEITGAGRMKYSSESDWILIHATPEQRCRAALAAVVEKKITGEKEASTDCERNCAD